MLMRHQNISLHTMIKECKGWEHHPTLIRATAALQHKSILLAAARQQLSEGAFVHDY